MVNDGDVKGSIMNISITFSIVGVVYITCFCLAPRLWMMYFSKAFTVYLTCIYKNLDQCLRSRSTPESR